MPITLYCVIVESPSKAKTIGKFLGSRIRQTEDRNVRLLRHFNSGIQIFPMCLIDPEDLDIVPLIESLMNLQSGGSVTAVYENLVSHDRTPFPPACCRSPMNYFPLFRIYFHQWVYHTTALKRKQAVFRNKSEKPHIYTSICSFFTGIPVACRICFVRSRYTTWPSTSVTRIMMRLFSGR